jgi:hypothetical protein
MPSRFARRLTSRCCAGSSCIWTRIMMASRYHHAAFQLPAIREPGSPARLTCYRGSSIMLRL